MPTLVNYLPFPNFRYYSMDNAGKEFGVIIVKGTFEIGEDGQLHVAEEQAPMIFTDKCHGEVNVSSVWHPSDLVPKKPTADIIVNAVALAPGGKPLPAWGMRDHRVRAGRRWSKSACASPAPARGCRAGVPHSMRRTRAIGAATGGCSRTGSSPSPSW